MDNRLELHSELLKFSENVYYQPPSNLQMKYPCIVYSKTGKNKRFSNNQIYLSKKEYQLTLIDRSPTSDIADEIESYLQYCSISRYYTINDLHHTTLILHY